MNSMVLYIKTKTCDSPWHVAPVLLIQVVNNFLIQVVIFFSFCNRRTAASDTKQPSRRLPSRLRNKSVKI
jgi:hypothetical protein